jgi:hypothetical protein
VKSADDEKTPENEKRMSRTENAHKVWRFLPMLAFVNAALVAANLALGYWWVAGCNFVAGAVCLYLYIRDKNEPWGRQ